MLTLNPWITAIEEEGAFAVLDKALALKATGAPVINLGIGQPDFPPPAHVLDAAARAAREGPHGYTSPVGIPPLREAVADHLNARYRTAVDPDQVVIVPGGKVTFYFACLLFGGPGAEILYPDPGFPPYRHAIGSGGATAVPYPIREERDFGFDADEILSLITPRTRLLMVNSPANPTGGVVARGELERLVAGLGDHPDVAVLSDEIYSHLVFEGADFASLTTFPEIADRLILLDGWSKTFAMTGWRLGYGVWPKPLVEHVRKLITVDHSCVNGVAQMAGLAALTGPMDEVRRMAEVFAAAPHAGGRRPQPASRRDLPHARRCLLRVPQRQGHRDRVARPRPPAAGRGPRGARPGRGVRRQWPGISPGVLCGKHRRDRRGARPHGKVPRREQPAGCVTALRFMPRRCCRPA
jgi:aspartate/methionine/tyrosine aminotransferase